MADIEKEVEVMILAGLGEGEQESRATLPADPITEHREEGEQDAKRVIDVDLYRLKDGAVLLVPSNGTTNPLDRNAVESDAPSDPVTETPTISHDTTLQEEETKLPETEEVSQPAQKQRRVKPSYVFVPLLLLLIFSAGTFTYLFLLPLTASADVTITPLTRSLHKEVTLTITASPHAGEVQGRSLAGMSLTKRTTVPATGHGHDNALQAQGVITFYNGDVNPITIPAGVSFTLSNQLTIVTTASATVQAAVDPLKGEANAPAQAVEAGTIGNIPAHAIENRCCGSVFVTATNTTPFRGGQDARDYTYIQPSDIRNASQDLLSSVTPQVTTALAKQVHEREQLVTPLCTPHTTTSQEPGAEAPSVTVSVTQTCKALAYSLDTLQRVSTALLSHAQNLTSYRQAGTVQVTVNTETYEQQTAHLHVTLSGTWVYSFSQRALTHLRHILAGVSKEKAQALLQQEPGIAQVSIQVHRLDFKDLLPGNPANIHLVFITLLL